MAEKLTELFHCMWMKDKKVQVGKHQEKAQSEKDSQSKTRDDQASTPRKHTVSRMSSYFPNRWPLSNLNLTKKMKTYIRR